MRLMRVVLIFISICLTHGVLAQEPDKRISPLALTSARYKDSYIKITYSQPAKRGREIFGGLVPYNQVWRTGANEATEITVTQDIIIQNQTILAGTYSIFTIPSPTSWIIILNKEVGLWGSYNYNYRLDIGRWEVPVKTLAGKNVESFTMQLDANNNIANLNFYWDNISITLPIQFTEPKK